MTTSSVVLVVLTVVGLPLLLWAIGRAVTAAGDRAAAGLGPSRQYLAGRLYGVQISALVDTGDELLVSLSAPATGTARASGDPLTQVFRVTASQCSLGRVRRWRDEGTLLRAYLSNDGAIMLADPVLGGNAACEPCMTAVQRSGQQAIPQDHSPTEDK
jgi:hypothetical protein